MQHSVAPSLGNARGARKQESHFLGFSSQYPSSETTPKQMIY